MVASLLLKTRRILAVVASIAVITLGSVGYLAVGIRYAGFSVPMEHTSKVVDGLVTIPAGGFVDYPLVLPETWHGTMVRGSFTVSGGNGNGLNVFVMTETNFGFFQEGRKYYSYYYSLQRPTDRIAAEPFPSGATYYLVYSNSSPNTKHVQTSVDMLYYLT